MNPLDVMYVVHVQESMQAVSAPPVMLCGSITGTSDSIA